MFTFSGWAAVLSARGSLRGGLGQLRIVSDKSNRTIIQSAVPEAIFVSSDDYEEIKYAVSKSDALAIGPGLGCSSQVGCLLEMLCECGGSPPVLLDADGLNMATAGTGPRIKDWTFERNVLLTPHLGEMARLSSLSPEFIGSDRLVVTKEFAE
ncbi:MAG TPA: NAD(P)H-hydrate dehydratase, partial [Gemmatimonadetes bacterium]|nr:NAD(P)H-hydrate dehydratase [Gemmatimonadota bacterium]